MVEHWRHATSLEHNAPASWGLRESRRDTGRRRRGAFTSWMTAPSRFMTHTCVSAIETSSPTNTPSAVSSSYDPADAIGFQGRAAVHYPMLKNSQKYSMWLDLGNIVLPHCMNAEACYHDGVLGESIFHRDSSCGVFQHNPPVADLPGLIPERGDFDHRRHLHRISEPT